MRMQSLSPVILVGLEHSGEQCDSSLDSHWSCSLFDFLHRLYLLH